MKSNTCSTQRVFRKGARGGRCLRNSKQSLWTVTGEDYTYPPHTATRPLPHHARTANCDQVTHTHGTTETTVHLHMHQMHTAQESEHTDHSHGAGRVHSDRNSTPDVTRDTRRISLTHRARARTAPRFACAHTNVTTPELLLPTTARHRSQPVVNRPLSRLSEPPARRGR